MAFRLLGEVPPEEQGGAVSASTPPKPTAPPASSFKLLDEVKPEPDQRSWFQRFVSEPATTATAKTFAGVGDMLMLPADAAASAARVARLMSPDTLPALGLDKRAAGLKAAEQAAEGPARFIVPQSGTEAGIMAGTMAAGGPLLGALGKAYPALAPVAGMTGKAGATMLQKLVPPAARIAGATVGGAVGGGVTGEGAGQGAAKGAVSSILGESALTVGMKVLRSLPGAQTLIDKKMARDLGQAIEDISAPLKGERTGLGLQQLATEGERKLGAAKDVIVRTIEATTKPLSIPSLGRKRLTLSQANERLTEMGKHAFGPAGTLADRQAYRSLSDEIAAGLDKVDPTNAARRLWEQAQTDYRKGLGLIDMLTPKPTFRRGPLGVRLSTPTVQEYLANPATQQELRSRLSPAEFAKITDVLTRGGGLGTKDVTRSLYPTSLLGGGALLGGAGLGYGAGPAIGGPLAAIPLLQPNILSRYAGRAPLSANQFTRLLSDLAAARGVTRATQPTNQP